MCSVVSRRPDRPEVARRTGRDIGDRALAIRSRMSILGRPERLARRTMAPSGLLAPLTPTGE